MVTVLFAEVVVKDGEVTGFKVTVPEATPATELAWVACVAPGTKTVLLEAPDNMRLVMVTTVSLVRVKVPFAIAV